MNITIMYLINLISITCATFIISVKHGYDIGFAFIVPTYILNEIFITLGRRND